MTLRLVASAQGAKKYKFSFLQCAGPLRIFRISGVIEKVDYRHADDIETRDNDHILSL